MFKPAPLTAAKVLDTFCILAKVLGKDSQERKRNHIKALLVAVSDCEPLYIIRLLQSKLRIGFAEQTVVVALAQAAAYSERPSDPPIVESAKVIKQVYFVHHKYDTIVSALLSDGVLKLPATFTFVTSVSIGPMLAKPTKGVSEILDKFQNRDFTCEYKYDGEHAQIHYLDDGSVEIYTVEMMKEMLESFSMLFNQCKVVTGSLHHIDKDLLGWWLCERQVKSGREIINPSRRSHVYPVDATKIAH